MNISDFSYDLPGHLIAIEPPVERGDSRLLVLDRASGYVQDKKYRNIVDYLSPGDLLVLNDTKVIKARLRVSRQDGSSRELVLLEKHGFDEDWHRHRVLYRRKISAGDKLTIGDAIIVVEEVQEGGVAIVKSDRDLLDIAERFGEVPLPPYIHRNVTKADETRYQTSWATKSGSVAAPTASLNMTDELLSKLRNKGVIVAYITLHVGLGTFLPIRTENIKDHHMHQEYFEISAETAALIRGAKRKGKKIAALGTTVARSLEYSSDQIDSSEGRIQGEADIFIYPGYIFRVVDILITNFHAPKSTVLMLAAGFSGWDNLMRAYEHAINDDYRFLSYGDSMLIL